MNGFEGAKVLLVGGAGFVGSNLTKTLLTRAVAKVHVVDNLLSAERVNVPLDERVAFTEASVTDDKVLSALQDEYDYVFHLATYHGNQSSIHSPLDDHENNTLTTLKLYERIKEFKNVKKVVYSSAGCSVAKKTFETAQATAEEDVVSLRQDSPYSMSKIFGEFYSLYYHKQHALPTVRARFQNVYGPGEILGAGKWRGTPATVWRNVIPTFIFRALRKLPLVVENNGIATRDFIYIDDIVEGLMRCALVGKPGEVYNLASGVETSIMDLALTINQMTHNFSPIEFLPRREWDTSGKRFGSTLKSSHDLCFSATTSINKGLLRTVKWTEENLVLIESTMKRHSAHLKLPL
jgi:nucleoside-diphosphate-sugar epimerase